MRTEPNEGDEFSTKVKMATEGTEFSDEKQRKQIVELRRSPIAKLEDQLETNTKMSSYNENFLSK